MSVIFTRAPLRISLGGGGTDLPSYYRAHGGFLIAGAIDKYIYMLTHTVFQQRFRLKYSEFEEVDRPEEIRHPILRETLCRHWERQPARDRLGGRHPGGHGPRVVGRVHRLPAEGAEPGGRMSSTPGAIAEAACHIEIDVLGEPSGKQDQYVAAHGGHLRLHLQPGRHGDRRAAAALVGDPGGDERRLPALLHGRDPQGDRHPPGPGPAHPRARRDDGGQPRPHQGDRPREPRAAGVGRPHRLRRC